MKAKKIVIISVITAIVILVVLMAFKPFAKETTGFTYETTAVEKGNIINTVTATGTVEAVVSVDVGTQVSGIIENVYVDFNDEVKQGQILAKLDELALQTQLQQNKASVDQAQAEFDYKSSNYERLKALYEKQLISKSDYDEAVYSFNSAKATLDNSKSAYENAKVNLEYATITSPISGVVLNREVEEGQTVAAIFIKPTLFTIVNDLTQMEVQTSVDEADIGKVKQGQRVEFTVDAYPDEEFEGTVSQVRLQPVTTNNVVTYTVILDAPNPEKKLMPGMTASATIFIDERSNVLTLAGKALRFTPDMEALSLTLPQNMPEGESDRVFSEDKPQNMSDAIIVDVPASFEMPAADLADAQVDGAGAQSTIWVLENDNIRPVQVTTGIENGSEVEIVSGLKEGDQVVVSMTINENDKKSGRTGSLLSPPGGSGGHDGPGGMPF